MRKSVRLVYKAILLTASVSQVSGCAFIKSFWADDEVGPVTPVTLPERDPFQTLLGRVKGQIEASNSSEAVVLGEIRDQLQYLVGQLAAFGAAPELDSLAIHVSASTGFNETEPRTSEKVKFYVAALSISWPESQPIPPVPMRVYLPRSGTHRGQKAFSAILAPACRESPGLQGPFWFHFRPAAPKCPLASDVAQAIAVKAELTLRVLPPGADWLTLRKRPYFSSGFRSVDRGAP